MSHRCAGLTPASCARGLRPPVREPEDAAIPDSGELPRLAVAARTSATMSHRAGLRDRARPGTRSRWMRMATRNAELDRECRAPARAAHATREAGSHSAPNRRGTVLARRRIVPSVATVGDRGVGGSSRATIPAQSRHERGARLPALSTDREVLRRTPPVPAHRSSGCCQVGQPRVDLAAASFALVASRARAPGDVAATPTIVRSWKTACVASRRLPPRRPIGAEESVRADRGFLAPASSARRKDRLDDARP
jgi:hypothetical protein